MKNYKNTAIAMFASVALFGLASSMALAEAPTITWDPLPKDKSDPQAGVCRLTFQELYDQGGLGQLQLNAKVDAEYENKGWFVYDHVLGAPFVDSSYDQLAVGTNIMRTVWYPFPPSEYTTASAYATVIIDPVKPTCEWNPVPLVKDNPLGDDQLCAKFFAVDGETLLNDYGTVTYQPAAGTYLTPGTHQIKVTFTPTTDDPEFKFYETTTVTVNLDVVYDDYPIIVWKPTAKLHLSEGLRMQEYPAQPPTPYILEEGMHLNAYAQDKSTNSLAGYFVYSVPNPDPSAGGYVTVTNAVQAAEILYNDPAVIGERVLYTSFFPTDPKFGPATAAVKMEILPAQVEIVWEPSSTVAPYGVALDETQLNAYAVVKGTTNSVPGTITYSCAESDYKPTVMPGNPWPVTATFTPESEIYESATATIVFDVVKGDAQVTWVVEEDIEDYDLIYEGKYPLDATSTVAGYFSYFIDGLPVTATKESEAITLEGGKEHEIVLTFTPFASVFFNEVTVTNTIGVWGTPTVNWEPKTPIDYQTPIGPNQLNATASYYYQIDEEQYVLYDVVGTWEYNPAEGTVLSVGLQDLYSKLTPEKPLLHEVETTLVGALEVTKIFPVIYWYGTNYQTGNGFLEPMNSVDHTIPYGMGLSKGELNATVRNPHTDEILDAQGTFVYFPALYTWLPIGMNTLGLQFEPDDKDSYNDAAKYVTIEVVKGMTEIEWTVASPITYGTGLTVDQIENATASAKVTDKDGNVISTNIVGTITYTKASGEPVAIGDVLDAGTHTLVATFTPDENDAFACNFEGSTKACELVVEPVEMTITWNKPNPIVEGTPLSAVQLNATCSQTTETPVYDPAAGTVLQGGDNTLKVTFAASDSNYKETSATVTIRVVAKPYIWWPVPTVLEYGTPITFEDDIFSDRAQARAYVEKCDPRTAPAEEIPGTFSYDPVLGTPLTAEPGTAKRLYVTFTPDDLDTYCIVSANVDQLVAKATPIIVWENPANVKWRTVLSGEQLNATVVDVLGDAVTGTFTYDPAEGTTLTQVGENTLHVDFVPDNADRYIAVSKDVIIVVDPLDPELVWEEPAPIAEGEPLTENELSVVSAAHAVGVCEYSDADGNAYSIGDILPKGDYVITAHFIPTAPMFRDAYITQIVTVGNTYRAATRALNPSLYWRLGEAADSTVAKEELGNTAFDLNSDGKEIFGEVGAITGDSNTAVYFSGEGCLDTLIESTDVVEEGTILAWVKRDGEQIADHRGVFVLRNLNEDGSFANANGLTIDSQEVAGKINNSQLWDYDTGLVTEDGEWNLIAMTWDTTGYNFFRGASNGVLSSVTCTDRAYDTFELSGILAIGADAKPSGGLPRAFKGWIDEVTVFPKVLTKEEIDNLYRIGLYGGIPTDVSLDIELDGSDIVISWPGAFGPDCIQTASSLEGPWTPISGGTLVGGAFQLRVPVEEGAFYRLAR